MHKLRIYKGSQWVILNRSVVHVYEHKGALVIRTYILLTELVLNMKNGSLNLYAK